MSAIAGVFNTDGRPASRAAVDGMAGALAAALAPQARGRPNVWREGPAALAHVPLAFTPEDTLERQPLIAGGGRFVLVSDARLDNREELAQELDLAPGDAARSADSVFIMKAYERWGDACAAHFLGAFAFALWDRDTRRLLCVRDRVGERVLFTSESGGAFAFASAPRGLFALERVPRRLNENKLADFLVLFHGDATGTFYDGIERLPAAHTLTVTPNGRRLDCYWRLDPKRRVRLASDDDYVDAARELLDDAVRCRLRSAGPIAVSMSGGLDSTGVACVAARHLKRRGERLHALTEVPRSGFDGPDPPGRRGDETALVETVRGELTNLDVSYVRTPGRTALDDLERVFRTTEAPMRNPVHRVWTEAIRERAAERGARVLLTGTFGNMTLSWGSSPDLVRLLLRGRLASFQRILRSLAAARGASLSGTFKSEVAVPLLPRPLWRAYRRWVKGDPTAWSDYSALRAERAAATLRRLRRFGRDPYQRAWRNGRAVRIEILRRGGGVDGFDAWNAWRAAQHLEMRDPTGDPRLQEFCLAIPEEQFRRADATRFLARRTLGGVVPDAVLSSRTRGFQAADWFERLTAARGILAARLEEIDGCETACRLLDVPRMRRLVDDWPTRGWNEPETLARYRELLLRGVVVGSFIVWFERERTERPTAGRTTPGAVY